MGLRKTIGKINVAAKKSYAIAKTKAKKQYPIIKKDLSSAYVKAGKAKTRVMDYSQRVSENASESPFFRADEGRAAHGESFLFGGGERSHRPRRKSKKQNKGSGQTIIIIREGRKKKRR